MEYDADVLISACAKKCNNFYKEKPKKKTSKISEDNQETKFMTLLTQMIPLLSNAHATNANTKHGKDCNKDGNGRNENGDGNRNRSILSKIEPCQLVCAGDFIKKYGRTSHCYPKQDKGKGVCVTHRPKDCNEWQRRKWMQKSGASAGQDSQQQSTAKQGSQQQKKQHLELSDSMKTVLTAGDLSALTTFL